MLLRAVLTWVHLAGVKIPSGLACWVSHQCIQKSYNLNKTAGSCNMGCLVKRWWSDLAFHRFFIKLFHSTKWKTQGKMCSCISRCMQPDIEVTVLVLVRAAEHPPAPLSSAVLPAVPPYRREGDFYNSRPLGNKCDEKIGPFFFLFHSVCPGSILIPSSFLNFCWHMESDKKKKDGAGFVRGRLIARFACKAVWVHLSR